MLCRTRTPTERTGELYGNFAFCFVVLTAFAQLALARRPMGEPWQLAVAFIGGGLYLILGVLSGRWTDQGTRRSVTLYFVGQIALLTAVLLLSPSRGFFIIIVLPLAAQAIFDLRWPGALLTNLWLFGLCVATIWIPYGRESALWAALQFSPAFVFTIAFSILTARAFRLRAEAQTLSAELAQANERLQLQSSQTEELAITRERNRLAREIHDGLGHYLTVIHVQIEAARALLAREPLQATKPLETAARLAREALDEVRRSVADLHQDQALHPLPERLTQLATDAGFPVRCSIVGSARSLSTGSEHALYRAVQEALTNVRKHAASAPTEVTLDYREPALVRLQVIDEGCTEAPPATREPAGFGLRGMHERIALLGGRLDAGPCDGGGFALKVELPG